MAAPTPKKSILNITPYKGGVSKANGTKKVIKLSSNETPLGPSPKAIDAYKNVCKTLHKYPDGNQAILKEAIAATYKINIENIVCGAGSDEIIALLCQAYINPGDEVIYTEHGFLMYPISTMAAGGIPVKVPEKNLTTDTNEILNAITNKTKIVFIANPNNPTGTYINKTELHTLRKQLPEDILLVIDGAYAEYVSEKDYTSGLELAQNTKNTVMTRTFSKIYGLAALRIGWAYCPGNIADIINRVRGPFNVSTAAIEAATAAILDHDFTEKTKAYNQKNLAYLLQGLTTLGLEVTNSVTNFVLVKFPKGEKNANNAYDFLMQKGIIARKVDNYGLSEYLRISIGLEEDNIAVVESLKEFIA